MGGKIGALRKCERATFIIYEDNLDCGRPAIDAEISHAYLLRTSAATASAISSGLGAGGDHPRRNRHALDLAFENVTQTRQDRRVALVRRSRNALQIHLVG